MSFKLNVLFYGSLSLDISIIVIPPFCIINNDFQNYKTTPRKYFGIQRGTTFEQFLKDSEKIPYAQCFLNLREKYSSYEKEMKEKRKRQQFRKDSQKFFQELEQKYKKEDLQPDKKLCVQLSHD